MLMVDPSSRHIPSGVRNGGRRPVRAQPSCRATPRERTQVISDQSFPSVSPWYVMTGATDWQRGDLARSPGGGRLGASGARQDQDMRVHVIVPGGFDDPGQPTGGNIYDRRVCAGLAEAGWEVLVAAVAAAWPTPDAGARADLA